MSGATSRRKTSSGLTAKDQTRLRIEKMEAERRERRLAMEKVSVAVIVGHIHP